MTSPLTEQQLDTAREHEIRTLDLTPLMNDLSAARVSGYLATLLSEVDRLRAELEQHTEDLAAADDPTQLRWGLNDVLWGDDDTVTVLLSGPDREPYWLELDPERAAVLREDLAGPPAEGPVTAAPTRTLLDAVETEALPAWEAMYEPGNVSDYLIGYANSEAAAKGAAEAWLRSQKDEVGPLEWVPQNPLDGYDTEFELSERHDDGIDTGPGITVRHRTPAV
jgi:hypothetical protein